MSSKQYIMNNPQLYLASLDCPYAEMLKMLELFAENLQRCDNDVIADIGCAAGATTSEILAKKIRNFRSILGLDLAPEFVTVANDKYKSSKITFEQLDIATTELPDALKNRFDKVFSLNCLHYINDMGQAFRNIRDMLAKDGQVFATYILRTPFWDIYVKLADSKPWGKYIENDVALYRKHLSNSKDFDFLTENLKNLLIHTGFDIKCLKLSKRNFTMNSVSELQNLHSAINPFMNLIPNTYIDEFNKNVVDEILNLELFAADYNKDGDVTKIYLQWDSVILHLTK